MDYVTAYLRKSESLFIYLFPNTKTSWSSVLCRPIPIYLNVSDSGHSKGWPQTSIIPLAKWHKARLRWYLYIRLFRLTSLNPYHKTTICNSHTQQTISLPLGEYIEVYDTNVVVPYVGIVWHKKGRPPGSKSVMSFQLNPTSGYLSLCVIWGQSGAVINKHV